LLPGGQRTEPLKRSRYGVAFAAVLTAASVYLSFDFFWPGLLVGVLPPLLAVALCVFFYRYRGVVAALPEPHGRGKVSVIGTDRVRSQGVLIIALGAAIIFVPFVALYFLPPAAVVGFILVLMGGLAASEVIFSAWITLLERRTHSTVLSLTVFREEEGRQQLVKSLDMEPWGSEGGRMAHPKV